jgi:hypothetical protein
MSDDTKKSSQDSKQQYTVTQTAQVVNAAGVVVTNNPIGAGRKWIKLWVDPWLDGTTRYMNSGSERAFWVDLLAEAGRSRFPGYICPGQENGQLIGYPLPWYQSKQPDLDIMATFQKFAAQRKIAYTITCNNPVSIVVQILNWNKYQAPMDDATRARMSRDRKKNQSLSSASRGSVTQRHDETSRSDRTREEGEKTERREDLEAEEEAPDGAPAPAAAVKAFALLDYGEPFGSPEFQMEWTRTVHDNGNFDPIHDLPDVMERCIVSCGRKHINVPPPFFDDKRKAEFRRSAWQSHYRSNGLKTEP